jgi:CheY-like chemotaxis protein
VTNVAQRIPILVAEDSEDNRFLLQAYCNGTSYDLTFAEDGEKAVEAFQAGDFKIVVMDIQMPVMDGLSATKEIRSLESRIGRKRTPILALTANLMPRDVVMAHQAGCDVHLPKPISKKVFLGALEQWKTAVRDLVEEPIRIEIQPGLERLAMNYLVSRERELPVLQNLAATLNFDELRRLAHNVKGTAAGYGFPELTQLGAVMEQAAIARNLDEVLKQMKVLEQFITLASIQVRKIC